MKFTCSVTIYKPLNEVVKHFKNPESLKQTQKGFMRIEHISGDKGQEGSKSKLVYKKFDLHETILHNKLPEEFYARYEHKNMTNTMRTKLVALNKSQTQIKTEIEYTKFKGFMVNFIAKVFPNMFKKQVDKWLVKFKSYVENQ